jgi:transcriptional regulator with XRE-family HTH domain
MTGARYKTLRLMLGTQNEVAERLGVHRVTIAKREAGTIPITTEAALAILALPKHVAERKKVAAVGAKRSCPKRKKYNESSSATREERP